MPAAEWFDKSVSSRPLMNGRLDIRGGGGYVLDGWLNRLTDEMKMFYS